MIDELPNNNNLKNNIIDSLDNNTKKEHESSKLKIFYNLLKNISFFRRKYTKFLRKLRKSIYTIV